MTALTLCMSAVQLPAQEASIYERGSTYLENTMPPSPEPASIVKYADVPFSHSSGLAEYDVPFHTLSGHELSIPIGLHYASGGIKLDEIAGVAGLGWSLEAGGCITRTVVDMPDEYSSAILTHQMPSGTLLNDLENMVENTSTMNYLRDLLWHRIDGSLDRYSYNVCGLSGSFVILDDGSVFQLSGDGADITYTLAADGSVDTFTITGPDGTVYTLSEKETATHLGRGTEDFTPTSGEPDRWSATTAWHITQMRSRSGLETALFTYSDQTEWDSSVYSITRSVSITVGNTGNVPTQDVSSTYIYKTHDTKVLATITVNGQTAAFTYATDTGSNVRTDGMAQENFPFRLTGISVSSSGNPAEIARLDVLTGKAAYDGRIVLNGLRLYRGNVLDDKWDFTYRDVGAAVSHGSQDWYGFYNGENEFTDAGNDSTCPFEFSQTDGLQITNGFPDPAYADYMSLKSVDHDGAITNFSYEGCPITSGDNTYHVGVRVKEIIVTDGVIPAYIRQFTYESPAASGPFVPTIDMYTTINMTMRPSGAADLYDWTYGFHDMPVALGTLIRDTRIFHGKVIEDVKERIIDSGEPSVRTVYFYNTDDMVPVNYSMVSRFPSEWKLAYDSAFITPALCSPWAGIRDGYLESTPSAFPLLTRREEYAFGDGAYTLVSSVDYTYDTPSQTSALVDYHVSQVTTHHLNEDELDYEYIYHFPIRARSWSGRHLIKEVHTGYHASGNDVSEIVTTYVPRQDIGMPPRIHTVSTQEAGVTRMTMYTYADTWQDATGWISDLRNQRLLDVPLKQTSMYINSTQVQQVFEDYKESVTEYGWFSIDGTLRLLPSIHKESNLGTESWRETVLSRDCMGNISSFKQKGEPETVVIWSYNGRYPVAVIKNTTMASVTSAMGGQTVIDAITKATAPSAAHKTSLSGLRASLSTAHVTTYEHIPGIGISSVTDPADITTNYEYTPAGRLSCVRDHDGRKIEEYEYRLMSDANGRRNMRRRVFRSEDGQQYAEDVRWWDVFGRRTQDIAIAASGDGRDLVTAYEADFMMHDDVKTWLPYPVQDTDGSFQTGAENAAAAYHGSSLAYHLKRYEVSARDRVTAEALPGYAGDHETVYETDVATGFPIMTWNEGGIVSSGTYPVGSVIVEKVTDADGRLAATFRDHAGRVLATAYGTDAPTYYIYDRYDRLRAVAGSGIQVSDTLDMWRYSYDSLGRIASKAVPGSIPEYYTYDEEDRVVSIVRGNETRDVEYDAMNRVTKVYQGRLSGSRLVIEQNTYDTPVANMSGANPKGLKTKSRIWKLDFSGLPTDYVDMTWLYDEMKRPVKTTAIYTDLSGYQETTDYSFTGEITSSTFNYAWGSGTTDHLVFNYTYDARGRMTKEDVMIKMIAETRSAVTDYVYDELGRPSITTAMVKNGVQVVTERDYTLQGWLSNLDVEVDGAPFFSQTLGYDESNTVAGTVPLHTGLITRKDEAWISPEGVATMNTVGYAYDHAGRLSKESIAGNITSYTYDQKGNLQAVTGGEHPATYVYDGYRMTSAAVPQTVSFTYDNFGRMTSDGLSGQTIEYNDLDLIKNIKRNDTTLVNYSYLADGTKDEALSYSNNDIRIAYRGPVAYRIHPTGGTPMAESATFASGILTRKGAMLYVKDYLGSVRAVVDGKTGVIYKASDFSAFGVETEAASVQTSNLPTAGTPQQVITLRDAYTGQEDQNPDFGTTYIDFGARQYSPTLRSWMTPDPMSEKYYGTSPYAFCGNNPVNFIDPDGKFPDIIWDIASVSFGVHSLVGNIQSGNVRGAIGDGIGIVVDVAAAALPFIPGGVGAVRAGAKAANAVDDIADAAKSVKAAASVSDGKIYVTYTKVNPKTGEVYSGRASGYGKPEDIVTNRDRNHHMNEKGFEPAKLDRYSTSYDAIRGREQYLIDLNGGAKSQGGSSGNAINGVSPTNPNKQKYEEASRKEFGQR